MERGDTRPGKLGRRIFILLAAVVVIGMLVGTWRYARTNDGELTLTLVRFDGRVHVGRQGEERPAKAGQTVLAEDHLRTEEGRAVLEIRGGTRFRLGPSSSVRVAGIDEAGVQLELEDGALRATVRPDSGSLAVTAAGVTAQATDAEFQIGVNEGVAVVESTRGDVALMGADVARVRAGSRAVIESRKAAVGPIPGALLLDVRWPAVRRTRDPSVPLEGRTGPAAVVTTRGRFGERTVRADAEGRFVVQVPLSDGENPVEIEARDALDGAAESSTGKLPVLDRSPPIIQGSVEYRP